MNNNSVSIMIAYNQIVFSGLMLLQSANVRPVKIFSNFDGPFSLNDISCHKVKCDGQCNGLPNVDQNFHPKKKTIYFIETSCLGGLKPKLSCSVESAASANPNWLIIVLFAGPLKPNFRKSKTFTRLMSIPNVFFYKLNTTEFAKGSLLEELFARNFLSTSSYPVGHSSDLLKLLTLHKFGGLYLDLDVIVMKSFDTLPTNFIAKQSVDDIASGIIAIARDSIGRNFADISIRDLEVNFRHDLWGGNSNDVYTRTLQKMCNTTNISQKKVCQGFHIMNSDLFYPIQWEDWIVYYKPNDEMANDTTAYMHHTWNSYGSKFTLQPNSLLTKLYEKYCPRVYGLMRGNINKYR